MNLDKTFCLNNKSENQKINEQITDEDRIKKLEDDNLSLQRELAAHTQNFLTIAEIHSLIFKEFNERLEKLEHQIGFYPILI